MESCLEHTLHSQPSEEPALPLLGLDFSPPDCETAHSSCFGRPVYGTLCRAAAPANRGTHQTGISNSVEGVGPLRHCLLCCSHSLTSGLPGATSVLLPEMPGVDCESSLAQPGDLCLLKRGEKEVRTRRLALLSFVGCWTGKKTRNGPQGT